MAVGNLSFFKSSAANFASGGRAGFYKPISSPPRIGLSQSSKQVQESILGSGAILMSTISSFTGTVDTARTQILALQSSATDPFSLDRIQLKSQKSGSLVDKKV